MLVRRRFFAVLMISALAGTPALAAVNSTAPVAVRALPPVERAWTERDYENALALFRQAAPSDLPRSTSPVLQRLIDPENLTILDDSSTPLDTRLRLGGRLVQSTTELLRLYLAALSDDPARNDDVLWVEAFMLQEASILVHLAEQRLGLADPTSEDFAERASGLTQMKGGLREVVMGCINALQTGGPARQVTREHLAAVLHTEWPRIAGLLSNAQRSEIEAALKQLTEREADPGVKAAFAGF